MDTQYPPSSPMTLFATEYISMFIYQLFNNPENNGLASQYICFQNLDCLKRKLAVPTFATCAFVKKSVSKPSWVFNMRSMHFVWSVSIISNDEKDPKQEKEVNNVDSDLYQQNKKISSIYTDKLREGMVTFVTISLLENEISS